MRKKVNEATAFYAVRVNEPLSRVMEYVEHASFVEIYGLKLA